MTTQEKRIAKIRKAIDAENVSLGELSELQGIAATHPQLFSDDALLAEWAGIPEEEWQKAKIPKPKAPKLSAEANRENARRKRQAREVLAHYAEITDQEEESPTTLLGDLLADCFHLLGPVAVNQCVFMGSEHYEAEARGKD